jgi:DNA repair protein RadD
MLIPRDYQSESATKALSYMRRTPDPGVLVLTTAAGKSIVVSIVAQVVQKAGKRVLCLAPNADLITQNAEKYRAIGEHCSLFSASLNKKHTGHAVVFGTPGSVVNSLDDFNDEYALLIIDECQMVSDEDTTINQQIISHLRAKNPKLRILGLTATPVRGKEKLVGPDRTFKEVIHELPHHVLSDLGYVVPYRLGITTGHYEMAGLTVQSNGKFRQADLDNATLGQERLTRAIIADVQRIMEADSRRCAMVFAASIKHGEEILSYLPEGSAAFITGKTAKGERARILNEARQGNWRFLITVTALGTGTDVPICDTVVFLRATESIGLLLQFMGRSCRLYDSMWRHSPADLNWKHEAYQGKKDALVLDYAENIERFSLDDDLTITGLVEAKNKQDDDDEFFPIACPDCGHENRHTAQRCVGVTYQGVRCEYRFIFKECPECQTQNSPSARHCYKCDCELINPNDKLTRNPAIAAGTPFPVAVMSMTLRQHWKGDSESLRVTYEVTDGDKTYELSEFIKQWGLHKFMQQVGGIANTVELAVESASTLTMPSRLMIKKKKGSKYFEVCNRTPGINSQNQLDVKAA